MKRRARVRASTVEPVSIIQIYARDGRRCHLCLGRMDKADRSIDHLIPVCRGGAHARWNLMAAHLACNKRRGTRQILPTETKEAAEQYVADRLAAYAREAAA